MRASRGNRSVGGNSRFLVGQRDKSSSAAQASDDADEAARGQGVIDNSSEYASMSMLAASHVRRRGPTTDSKEEWTRFSERILDAQADEKSCGLKGAEQQIDDAAAATCFFAPVFTDPSDLLMVLAALIHRSRLKRKQLEQLEALREQLEAEDLDRSAQAGINIALVAKAFAQKMQQSEWQLGECCIASFFAYDGPAIYLYEQWAEEMVAQERENIIRYLARALACDLQALPLGNINVSEFGALFNRVSRLREMQSLDDTFRQRFSHTDFAFINQSGENMLSKLFISGIRGQENFNDSLLTFYSRQLGALSTDMRARFLQILIIAFSILPTGIFSSLEEREHFIDGLKENMSHFMEQELAMARRVLHDEEENIP
uniref:YsaW n=1 Tax=Yersinia enterocolitica TaxID=630 RepID=Q9KKH7_YEREN|nr:YsaW [Yersinia enterocolitica]